LAASDTEVIRRAWRDLEPLLAEQGYELVELEFGREGAARAFRVFIDRIGEGGVTLDDCQAASQLLSPVLDARGLIEGRYMLEVSSPGVDRRLRKPEDFQRFAGQRVRIVTHTPVGGRRRFRGALAGFSEDTIALDCEDGGHTIHIGNVKKANLDR